MNDLDKKVLDTACITVFHKNDNSVSFDEIRKEVSGEVNTQDILDSFKRLFEFHSIITPVYQKSEIYRFSVANSKLFEYLQKNLVDFADIFLEIKHLIARQNNLNLSDVTTELNLSEMVVSVIFEKLEKGNHIKIMKSVFGQKISHVTSSFKAMYS